MQFVALPEEQLMLFLNVTRVTTKWMAKHSNVRMT